MEWKNDSSLLTIGGEANGGKLGELAFSGKRTLVRCGRAT
jgi:hypothetical protein